MVSVIVLTYNHEKYIRQALDSILMQEVDFKYEVLVGDDCSTDKTTELLQGYINGKEDIIQLYVREKNIGPSKNLYQLLQVAKGKYIAFCEGDDYWADVHKLQKQIQFLEENIGIIGCTHRCEIVNENGVPMIRKLNWISEKEYFSLQDFQGYILPGQLGTLVCRNIFLSTKHDFSVIYKAHPIVSDRTLMFLLLLHGEIYVLCEKMSCYRIINDGSNATAFMFENNADVNLLQCQLTKKLEEYARTEFQIKVRFTRFKIEQYIKYCVKKIIR